MKRTDFILLWTNKDDIYYNTNMCHERLKIPNIINIYDLHCPIKDNVTCISSHTFNNRKDIIIATIKECKAKELIGCIRNCNNCVTGLLIKAYNEKSFKM